MHGCRFGAFHMGECLRYKRSCFKVFLLDNANFTSREGSGANISQRKSFQYGQVFYLAGQLGPK